MSNKNELEQNLHDDITQNRYKEVLDAVKDGVWDWDMVSNKVYYSQNYKSMLGYEEEDIAPEPGEFFNNIHPEDQEKIQQALNNHLSDPMNNTYSVEFRMKTKYGSYKWILTRGKAYFDEDSNPIRMLGTHTDISHIKDYQQKLKENDLRWKFAIEGNGDGLWEWDLDTNEVYFSKQWKKMLGFKDHEITGSLAEWEERVNPEHIEDVFKDINNYLEGKTEYYENEHQVLCKDGTYKWILDRGIAISRDEKNSITKMIGTHRDIDKEKKDRDEYEKLFLNNKALIDNLPILVWIKDKQGRFLAVNKKVKDAMNISDDNQVIGKTDFDIWPKEFAQGYVDDDNEVLRTKKTKLTSEKILNNEIPIWFETFKTVVYDNNENISGTMGYAIDITDKMNTQELLTKQNEEINKQKEEFESIFKNAKDGIAITDLDMNFVNCNQAFCEMIGYNFDEVLTKNCSDLTAPEYKEINKKAIENAQKSNQAENIEKECIRKDNNRIIVNMTASMLPDKERMLLIMKDITHFKSLEEQSKLASMGEMLNNIAHQWRQPLSVITTASSAIKLRTTLDEEISSEDLIKTSNQIITQANYLSNTIDDFREFTKISNKRESINVSEVIDTALKITDATLKSNNIEILLMTDDDLIIFVNKNELVQAIINIINNAKDILTEKIKSNESRKILFKTIKNNNNSLSLKIIDSAGGIEKDIIDKVFEPYFTTKHKSVGTGLGLSITHKIINNKFGYDLSVSNESFSLDKDYYGACFKIDFHRKPI